MAHDTARDHDIAVINAVAISVTAFGLLTIAGLLVSALVLGNRAAVICSLLASACAYAAMYASMLALGNPDSLAAYSFARTVNPTMTLLTSCFWAAGMLNLWG